VGTAEKVVKVRGQRSRLCVHMRKCYNGGWIHFDGVASRLDLLF